MLGAGNTPKNVNNASMPDISSTSDATQKADWAAAFADTYLWLDPGNPQYKVLYDWGCLLWDENKAENPDTVATAKFNVVFNSKCVQHQRSEQG